MTITGEYLYLYIRMRKIPYCKHICEFSIKLFLCLVLQGFEDRKL